MKKTFAIISCILFVATFVSCANISDIDNPQKNNVKTDTHKNYVLYYYPSAGEIIKDKTDTVDITFKYAEEKVFSFSSKTNIDKPSDTGDQYSFDLNGKKYSVEYSRTYETALSSSNTLGDYSKFNSYRSDNIRVDTRASTNELLLFTNLDETDLKVIGSLTEKEAKNIAETTILSLYGEELKSEYTYEETIYTDTELSVQYTVVYRRYVWDTPTNDSIQISINMNGEVVGINAKSLGMFSFAEKQIEKKSIEDAICKLEETLSNEWNIVAKTLVLDSEGNYYISAQLYCKNNQEIDATIVYINIV